MHFTFCSKQSIFEILENKTIRHIKTAIPHLWRVANGLDNAVLGPTNLILVYDFLKFPECLEIDSKGVVVCKFFLVHSLDFQGGNVTQFGIVFL